MMLPEAQGLALSSKLLSSKVAVFARFNLLRGRGKNLSEILSLGLYPTLASASSKFEGGVIWSAQAGLGVKACSTARSVR